MERREQQNIKRSEGPVANKKAALDPIEPKNHSHQKKIVAFASGRMKAKRKDL